MAAGCNLHRRSKGFTGKNLAFAVSLRPSTIVIGAVFDKARSGPSGAEGVNGIVEDVIVDDAEGLPFGGVTAGDVRFDVKTLDVRELAGVELRSEMESLPKEEAWYHQTDHPQWTRSDPKQ